MLFDEGNVHMNKESYNNRYYYSRMISYDMKVRPYIVALTRNLVYKDKTTLNCIVANLLACVRKSKYLAYSRRTGERAVNRKGITTRRVIKAVDFLEEQGLITNIIGTSSAIKEFRRISLMHPTGKLLGMLFNIIFDNNDSGDSMESFKDGLEDFIEYNARGFYIKEAEKDYLDSIGGVILRDKNKQVVKFSNTKYLNEMSRGVRALNLLLHNHIIRDGDNFMLDNIYCRIFNETFDYGGRYYRADILEMPNHSNQRLDVTINGSRVVEVDYNNLHIRLACAINNYGVGSLGDDAYSSILDVSNSTNRKVVKLAVNVMFNCATKVKAYGAVNLIIRRLTDEEKAEYTLGTAKNIVEMIIEAYPALKHEFCTTNYFGKVLQNADSHLASNIIRTFVAEGIPILPIHDSFITTLDKKDFLCYVMGTAFREVLGVDYPVPLTSKWKGGGVIVREDIIEYS